jgi:hypothetical protein
MEYYALHRDEINKRRKGLYLSNRDKILEQQKEWRKKHPQTVIRSVEKWKNENPDKVRASKLKWQRRNVPQMRDALRLWRRKYPDRYREQMRRANTKRRSTPKGRLVHAISSGIIASLQNGTKRNRKWESLVGYGINDLVVILERKFIDGMSWDNYGEWHVDHIIPISAFNFEKPEDLDFKRCWSLSNLQPMWGDVNRSKKDSVSVPFQPSLCVAIP